MSSPVQTGCELTFFPDESGAEEVRTLLLENKTAVVYGASGSIGGAVARSFAREGARVFLAGRTRSTLETVAREIAATGGSAEVAEVDALDEYAVDEHATAIVRQTGQLDISFNSVGHGDVHGTALLEMPFEDFARPVFNAVRTLFLTTRAAARHMTSRGTGVIMTVTATTARQSLPEVGGTGVAFDAMESLCRQWACELGSAGVRVVWLHTTGIPEALHDTGGLVPAYGTGKPMTMPEHNKWMSGKTMMNRLTTLADVGTMAAVLASDAAGSMTATNMNLTYGAAPAR